MWETAVGLIGIGLILYLLAAVVRPEKF
ncbi:MAG: potassium-transporting ATPase subunit F [Deltaproteobacteria bacterium]|nr:potassium-transporting ATPase subunit F [Deltaproteobacteria bacterium]